MTTKTLEYFQVVVKHLNISKAAKELFISQPALSKQNSQLEAQEMYRKMICICVTCRGH